MPLQASATSSTMVGRRMMFPSRNTGTPSSESAALARYEASNCKGIADLSKNDRGYRDHQDQQTQGNSQARKKLGPARASPGSANKNSSDARARKSSAPKTPPSITSEKTTTARPAHEGFTGKTAKRARLFQTTRPENMGTRKPCPNLESCRH